MRAGVRALPLVERLHVAQRVKVEAEARAAARAAAPRAALERSPIHACGCRMVRCVDCAGWVCRAPCHALHVCASPEFAQMVEGTP